MVNTDYLTTNRGIIKIAQIIIGIVVVSLLCANWFGGRSCFYEGRVGYASGVNFVATLINIVLFILTILEITHYKGERIYSLIFTVLFLIAAILLVWMTVVDNEGRGKLVTATILIVVQFVLTLFDFKILNGEASN